MRKGWVRAGVLALAALAGLCGPAARGQAVRWDYTVTTTQGTGTYVPIYAVPGVGVRFYSGCTSLPCLTPAVTYTNAAAGTACGSTTQIVLQTSSTCVGTADPQANFGVWIVAGTYQYVYTIKTVEYGPYNFTAGGGGSSGGEVTSYNGRTGAVVGVVGDLVTAAGTQAAHVVCTAGPTSGSGATSCRQLTADDIAAGFAISTFTCSTCSTYELGHTVASPTNFTASYTSLPASASISDGTHTTTLSTPFTSGSLAFSYVSNTIACTTYTLTAVAVTTQTSTAQSCWQPRTFYGVGTGGATGATASGNNAALTGATGTLGTWGLGTNTGTVSVSPSSQYIYFLLSTSGHTFTVNGFTTTFSVTTITFTNQNSIAVTMYLYQSPASLTGTYSVGVS